MTVLVRVHFVFKNSKISKKGVLDINCKNLGLGRNKSYVFIFLLVLLTGTILFFSDSFRTPIENLGKTSSSLSSLNLFIPQLSEKNIEIDVLGKEYEIIDISRKPIVFGKPVEWEMNVSDGNSTFSLEYETPQIDFFAYEEIDGHNWVKKITLTTDYDELYYDILFDTSVPEEEFDIKLSSGYDTYDLIDNRMFFALPELLGTEEIVLSGVLENISINNISFEYLFMELPYNGTVKEYAFDTNTNILIPVEFFDKGYTITSVERGQIIFGQSVHWKITMNDQISGEDFIAEYETPPIYADIQDSIEGLRWKKEISLSTSFPDIYQNVEFTTEIPYSSNLDIEPELEYNLSIINPEDIISSKINILIPSLQKINYFEITGFFNESYNLTPINQTNFILNTTIYNDYNHYSADSESISSFSFVTEVPAEFADIAQEIQEQEIEIRKINSQEISAQVISEFDNPDILEQENLGKYSGEIDIKKNALEDRMNHLFDGEIIFEDKPFKSMEIKGLYVKDSSIELGIEEIENRPFLLSSESDNSVLPVQIYAVDPSNLNFTNATLKVTAKGNILYKCSKWNFTNQSCYGDWIIAKEGLIPGKEYSIELSKDDPGFFEILINKAEHLDDNREFISDIYSEVYSLDDIWSEEIPDGHYVRIRFDIPLTSLNDITIFPRIVSGSPIIEIYESEEDIIIAEFNPLVSNDYNKVFLTSLVGEQDTFDLRIIGGSVEFDYITDPPLVSIISPTDTVYSNATILVNISSNGEYVWYNWNGADTIYNSPVNVVFDAGLNTLHVWANDTDNNISYTNVTFYVDTLGPEMEFVSPTPSNGDSWKYDHVFVNINSNDYVQHYSLVDWNSSLLGWWRFENSDAADDSDYGNDGTVVGASSTNNGRFGKAMTFNGAGNYIDTNLAESLSLGSFSVFTWVKNIPSGNMYVITQTRVAAPYSSDWILGYPNGGLWFRSSTIDGGNTISNGNWHLLGFTFNGTTAKLYIDGAQTGSSINPSGFGGVGTVKLMTRGDATTSFTSGTMDDVLIFNRTISLSEIESLYNSTLNQYHNNFTNLEDGDYSFKGHAVDLFGNKDGTELISFEIDSTLPNITLYSPTNKTYFANNILINISAFDESGIDNIWYNWNATNHDYVSPEYINFSEGPNVIIVWANDTFGNIKSVNVSFQVNSSYVDEILPSVLINSPDSVTYNNAAQLVNLSATDNTEIDSIWYNWNGTNTTFNGPTYVLFNEGLINLVAWANDTFGNINFTEITFNIDTTAPSISFSSQTPSDSSFQAVNYAFINVSASDIGRGNSNVSVFIDFDNSLVGWWRMDDIDGNTILDYTGKNDGTNHNLEQVRGHLGDAMEFEGSGDYITSSNSDSLGLNQNVTLSVWFNCPSGVHGVMSSETAGRMINLHRLSPGTTLAIIVASDGLGWYNSGKAAFNGDGVNPCDSSWHLGTLTQDGAGNLRLYKDGNLVKSDVGGSVSYSSYPLHIGSYEGLTRFFKGMLDDVMIFNRSLSAEEVSALYTDTTSKYLIRNFTGLENKNYTFTAYAQDTSGNVNPSEQRDFGIDTVFPSLVINSPQNTTYKNPVQLVNITATDENLDSVWYRWNITDISYSDPVYIDFGKGSRILHVWANDTAGNINYTNVSFFSESESLSQCGAITSSGVYMLNQSVTSTGTCFSVSVDNVEIDCNGNTITYDTAGTATRMGIDAIDGANPRQNLTVRNCIIVKPTNLQTEGYGIRLTRFSNSSIINNQIYTNGTTNNYGIFLTTNSGDNLIENNTINAYGTTTGNTGLYIFSASENNVVRNNIISGYGTTTSYGVWISTNSNNALIEGNTISSYGTTGGTNSDSLGVYITLGNTGTIVRNNNISTYGSTARNYGIYMLNGILSNQIFNNTISTSGTTTNHGIYVSGASSASDTNEISYNTISTSGTTTANYGIHLYRNVNSNNIHHNTISTSGTTGNHGIYGVGTTALPINNNKIELNEINTWGTAAGVSCYGIYLSTNANSNNITNNNVTTHGTTANYGIHILGANLLQSEGNKILSNKIQTLGTTTNNWGIHLSTNTNNNEIMYNNITTYGTSANYGIYVLGTTTLTSNSNKIDSNKIQTIGTTTNNAGIFLSTNANSNDVINNTISTSGSTTNYGININGATFASNSNEVTLNTITTSGTAESNHGIYIYRNSNLNNITQNTITTAGTTTSHGIYATGTATLTINNNKVASNDITTSGTAGTSTNYGIVFTTNANSNNITNNTITTSGTTGSHGIYFSGATFASNSNEISYNNISTSGTAASNYGIYLYRNINSNHVIRNTISTSGTSLNHGIYLTGTTALPINNNKIESNIISTTGTAAAVTTYGISLATYANNNNITNNTITTHGTTANYGIYVVGANLLPSNNNLISSNRIETLGTTTNNWGIYLTTNTNNNNIINNNVTTHGTTANYGIYVLGATTLASNSNTISSNNIQTIGTTTNNWGIYLATNVNSNNITQNTISTSGTDSNYGIYLLGAAAQTVANNLFFGNSITTQGTGTLNHGIVTSTNATYNTLTSNTITTSGTSDYGLYLYLNSNRNILQGNDVAGDFGYYMLSSSNNLIRDCLQTTGTTNDVYVNADITPMSLNNTFLNCTYTTESVNGVGNYLTREWYFDVFVNDSLGYLENANILALNITNGEIINETTDVLGTIPQNIIAEYTNYWGSVLYHTPHTFIVSKKTYTSNTSVYDLSSVQNIKHFVILAGDITPPSIVINTPQNLTYISQDLFLNISVIEDNPDTTWYNWNGTNVTYTNPVMITFPEGMTTIHVWANDTLGHINYTNVSFTVTVLHLEIISPQNTTYFEARHLVNISTSGVPVEEIWYNWNGTNVTYSSPIDVTFRAGSNTLFAFARDQLNNIVTTNVTFTSQSDEISDCGTISASGFYVLSNDINSTGTCLTVIGDDIEINCNGHSITYDTSGTATRMGIDAIDGSNPHQNLIIRNCMIVKPTNLQTAGYGIRLTRFSNSSIINNTIYTNGTTNNYGIFLTTSAKDNLIENNTISAYGTLTGNIGVYVLSDSTKSTIQNNIISTYGTTTSYGIMVATNSHNSLIDNNRISTYGSTTGTYSDSHGIYIYSGNTQTTVQNNNISTAGMGRNYGIYLQNNVLNNQVLDNTISTSGTTVNHGIYLFGTAALPANNNQISGNNILTSGTTNNFGIHLSTNTNSNNITGNIINTGGTSGGYGIYVLGTTTATSNSNIISSNNVHSSGTTTTNAGILLATNANSNKVINNTISTSGTATNYGVYISGDAFVSNSNEILSNNISTFGTADSNYGIYVYRNSNYNKIIQNTITTSGTTGNNGIYFAGTTAEPTDYNRIESNIINANTAATLTNYGIILNTYANNNNITNNTITTHGTTANYGIYVVGTAALASNSNTISSNRIETLGTTTYNWGIHLTTNTNSNTITHNNITTHGTTANYGIYVLGATTAASNSNTISSNNIHTIGTTTNNWGIYLATNVNSNNVTQNTISTSGTDSNYGIYLLGAAAQTVANNIFSGNSITTQGTGTLNHGIVTSTNATYNTLTSNTITTSGTSNYGVYLNVNSNKNTLQGNDISGAFGYYILSASHNTIRDCLQTTGTTNDVYVNADITPMSLNNTFLNCTYTTESVNGVGNYLTREWYFDIFVNNSLGYLADAIVRGYNISNSLLFNENTTVLGTINRKELVDYVNNWGTRNYATPHLFRVSKRNYNTNSTSYNITTEQNVKHFVLLTEDITPPTINIISPQNKSYSNPLILLNISATDDNLEKIWYNWNGTNYNYSAPLWITFNEGQNIMHVWANDTAGNINYTNVSFIFEYVDLVITDIILEPGDYIEGESRNVDVNITNLGNNDSSNFTILLNVSLWNGTKIMGQEDFSQYLSLNAGQSQIVQFNWIVQTGTHIFEAYADFYNNVTELNETNNDFFEVNKTVSAWHTLYGNFSYRIILSNSANATLFNWSNTLPRGNSYFSDADSNYMPFDLLPMNGSDDLEESDIALGMVGFNDSISKIFDSDDNGVADNLATITIADEEIENVPIIYSTDNPNFITGILYDSADGPGYDGSQDIVFVTMINDSMAGKYGVYDYEIRLPSPLKNLKPGASNLARFDEMI